MTRWQRIRLAVVLWWRRTFWPQWDEASTPHRTFWTRCSRCGDEVANVAPVEAPGAPRRITWECARCLSMTAVEVRRE